MRKRYEKRMHHGKITNFQSFHNALLCVLYSSRNVRLGEYDNANKLGEKDCLTTKGGENDCNKGAIAIPIEKLIPHPDYDSSDRNSRHDIALLRMTRSAPFSRKLITITKYLMQNMFNVRFSETGSSVNKKQRKQKNSLKRKF